MSHIPHPAFGGTVSAIVHNQLIMPGKNIIFAPFTIAAGQVLKAGSVLGAVTATGKLLFSLAAAGDGSEVPMAVLLEDLDTTAGDKTFQVAVEGYFNEVALVYGTGHTADTVRLPLRAAGIYLKNPRHSFA